MQQQQHKECLSAFICFGFSIVFCLFIFRFFRDINVKCFKFVHLNSFLYFKSPLRQCARIYSIDIAYGTSITYNSTGLQYFGA